MSSEPLALTLTADEALVLFDVLHRWEDQGTVGPVEDEAEAVALWNLSASLESILVEPFKANYTELVASARARLIGKRA